MPQDLILYVIPLAIIQLTIQVFALVNVSKKETNEIRFESKLVWVLIIIFGSMLGAIAYFLFGGNPNGQDSGQD